MTKMTENTQYLDFYGGLSAWDKQANRSQANSKWSLGIKNLMFSLKENLCSIFKVYLGLCAPGR